ncbi:mechanosensitive ion channel family protein [Marilutibacter chinensis]|uniref:Small-conductance mechanosensitive channel n=1 Tax=Marilutibacter chinensis TaxID=2912247 RepID=A0ABS9HQN4_9GAMM|nr:mechanosensitive ion channel domain-containing protein [Lysobacter chinensis]MCF7220417.1 mechanosensitive ion channel [Lysobacter chinensis]
MQIGAIELGSEWLEFAINLGVRLAIGLVVFYIGLRVARWLAGASERGLSRASVDPIAVRFLRKVVYVGLLVVLILGLLQGVFGVAPTSMIAVLGAAGLAIGMALKDSLSNVASGVMLVSLKPFRVGDIVTIAGETGMVEDVSIFQTKLRGADNQLVVLPNSLITSDSIINLTPDVRRRIELVIGIGYTDDIDIARKVALDIMAADERILAEPAPDVLVYELADNSVNLGIRCHVANADWFVTKCELTERIKKGFDASGVSIPFPQRDVHMYHHVAGGPGGPAALPPQVRDSLDSPDHQPSADPE